MINFDNIIGVEETSNLLGLSPGTVKNKCASREIASKKIGKTWIIDKTKLTFKEWNGMKVWIRDGYSVEEKKFTNELHIFEVINENGQLIGTITPENLADMEEIIADLDDGDDVNNWRDGTGGVIKIKKPSY